MQQELSDLARRFSEKVPHNQDLGIEVVSVGDAVACMRLSPAEHLLGDVERGHIFNSVLYSLADSCCGLAVFSAIKELSPIATLDMRMEYLRPAAATSPLVAKAHCFRVTRDVAFVRCEIVQDNDETPVAIGSAAFMRSGVPRSKATPHEQ